ncbi:MAG: threonine synthase [Halapricum sp.]
MEMTEAFAGLRCTDCGESHDAAEATHRCPDCGGILDPVVEIGEMPVEREDLTARPFDGIDRYAELLPFTAETLVTMDEGTTPLVSAPDLATELGVEEVLVKDEGRNPTGSFKDRGAALAVTAAVEHGAETVALPSAGNAGQAASAYAARAGLDSEVFVPSRATFDNKAMINVHGGGMTVVDGRLSDAGAAFEDAIADEEWYSVATFETPYRHEGKKTMFYEIAEQRDWVSPDHVVYPTGGGVGLVGMAKAAREFRELGWIEEGPAFHAAQAAGCAPIVDAWEAGRAEHEPVEHPDTICGGIEVSDPGASRLVLDAVRESGGTAVSTPDEEILDAAVEVAQTAGIEMGATCGAAASGARELAEQGVFGSDDTVVLVNTATGNKESDVLRSRLMSRGI